MIFVKKIKEGVGPRAVFYKLLIFLAAFLLFSVEPLISKTILPWFGGSPAVWTTALLFFQSILLGGYALAYWLNNRQLKFQKFFYALILILALLIAVISWPQSDQLQAGFAPVSQILLLLAFSVGWPYLVLSSVSPLLQSWFHQGSDQSPYSFYAWSNAGSLVGLLSYPIIIEPFWTLSQQRVAWLVLLLVLALGLFFLLGSLGREKKYSSPELLSPQSETLSAPWSHRWGWLLWPLGASLMLLAVTNYVTQDIAAVPLLWVVPLSLYLLSFILTFGGESFYQRRLWAGVFLLTALSAVLVIAQKDSTAIVLLLLSMLGILFATAMVCHGELYRLRPPPAQLAEFYLWVAAGGALGGFLVAVIAPLIFSFYAELHLALALMLIFTFILWQRQKVWIFPSHLTVSRLGPLLISLLCLVILVFNIQDTLHVRIKLWRDFFGTLNINDQDDYRVLGYGTTLHGLQFKAADKRCWPTSYYGHRSGLGVAVAKFGKNNLRLGVVGLGVGTAAVYGSEVRFYELNPRVATIAQEDFHYLSDCSQKTEIVLGDARLSLAKEADQNFDILVIDAFTSDAIPVHLLTQEAFDVYRRHIQQNGVIAVHISNRYVDFRPVIGGLAEHFSLLAVIIKDKADQSRGTANSVWALLSSDRNFFDRLIAQGIIKTGDMDFPRRVLWTDKYSNIFTLLKLR